MNPQLPRPPAPRPPVSTAGVCLILVVLLCVFEAAARKWLFPGSPPRIQAIFYFLKDVPLTAAVVLAARRRHTTAMRRSMYALLAVNTVLITVGTVMSLDEATLIGATVSLRSLVLLPWAAYLVGPGLIGRRDFLLLMHTVGACAVVNAGLGVVQFTSPGTAEVNRTVSDDVDYVGAAGRVRASGTFAFVTGISDLGLAAVWAGTILLTRSFGSPSGFVYLLAGLVCVSVSMSRIGAAGALWIISFGLLSAANGRRILGVLAVAGAMVLLLYPEIVSDFAVVGGTRGDAEEVTVANALVARHVEADSFGERLTWMFWQTPQMLLDDPLGNGLGVTQTGQFRAVGAASLLVVEFDLARVCYEIGFSGLAGALLARVGVIYLVWRRMRVPTTGEWGHVLKPSFWLLILMPVQQITFNHVLATYLFVVVACVCRADTEGVQR